MVLTKARNNLKGPTTNKIEHCFTENHGENRVPNISTLSCIFVTNTKFTGYSRCKPL